MTVAVILAFLFGQRELTGSIVTAGAGGESR